MDDNSGAVPSEGVSSAGSGSGAGPLSYLNASWINGHVANVRARVDTLMDRLIDDGLLGSGYPPFETPVTDEMLQRMSPDEFRALYDSITSLKGKSALLARQEALKLPPRELLPQADRARYPVPRTVAGEEAAPVQSGVV